MSRAGILRLSICLGLLCLLSVHCFDPNLPGIQILLPETDTALVGDAPPFSTEVEVLVPLPGCGAASYPVDPETFRAVLERVEDGKTIWEEDVSQALGAGVLDPETAAFAWSGEVELPAFGEYTLRFSVQNERGQGTAARDLRAEQTATLFPGGDLLLSFSSLGQDPAGCLAPEPLLGLIHPVIKDLVFPVDLPSGAEILASGNAYPLTIGLPNPIPSIRVVLHVDETSNDILMDGPDDYTINLNGLLPIPDLDCIITAAMDGGFHDLDPTDVDGMLIGDLTVETAPGGTCSLVPSGDGCFLLIGLDGDLY